jgi:hypothetical protein
LQMTGTCLTTWSFQICVVVLDRNAMAAFNSPVKELVQHCNEYDDETRDCLVLLYTRPVDNPLVGGLISPTYLQHWSLVAYFKDGDRLLTFEIMENDDNVIEAYRTCGAYDNSDTERHRLGNVRTSPKKLLTLAQRHSYNGMSFNAVSRNCQEWVKEFASMISSQLRSWMDRFATCKEKLARNPLEVLPAIVINALGNGVVSSRRTLAGSSYSRHCDFAASSVGGSSGNSLRGSFSSGRNLLHFS